MTDASFFEGVAQSEVEIAGERAWMPIFYRDAGALTALFPARLSALRRALPDRRFVPARLAPGVGALAITAFEYRDSDVGAYNELAVSIVLNEPWVLTNLPGRALGRSVRAARFDAFILHLPVTTEIAREGGREFWNFPKFVAEIEIDEEPAATHCRLAEAGEQILSLRAPHLPSRGPKSLRLLSHTWMHGRPQRAEVSVHALQYGEAMTRACSIELGANHSIAAQLREMLLSRRSLHLQTMPRFESILYGPDQLSLPILDRAAAHRSEREAVPA